MAVTAIASMAVRLRDTWMLTCFKPRTLRLPSSWADYPHHEDKDDDIVKYLLNARKFFEENDDECYFYLGVAFHYIEDRWTLRYPAPDKHAKYEREIKDSPFLDISQLRDDVIKSNFPTKVEKTYLDLLESFEKGFQDLVQSYVDLNATVIVDGLRSFARTNYRLPPGLKGYISNSEDLIRSQYPEFYPPEINPIIPTNLARA
jgi:hypothetical protein